MLSPKNHIFHPAVKVYIYLSRLFFLDVPVFREKIIFLGTQVGRHHIPLLLFGNVLKEEVRGKTIQKTSLPLDIAATLFAQLGIKVITFSLSKNLMNPHSKGFAFYAFDDGFGCITDSTQVIYDHNVKSVIHHTAKFSGIDHQKTIRNGKAFMQMVFEKYIAL